MLDLARRRSGRLGIIDARSLASMFLWVRPIVQPGALTVLGAPVDYRTIGCDVYVVGATTDHLTPWRTTYWPTQLFGGEATFVLGTRADGRVPADQRQGPLLRGPRAGLGPGRVAQRGLASGGNVVGGRGGLVAGPFGRGLQGAQPAGEPPAPALDAAPGRYVHF